MKHTPIKFFLLALVLTSPLLSIAQEFMFQGWTWQYPVLLNGKRYAQRMANEADKLGKAGFTQIWVPPLSRGSSGSGSMGYDPQDLYDLGQYAGMVRAGTRPQIDMMIDSFAVNGIETVADLVFNHRDNGKPELNPAVEGWIRNFTNNGNCPFPSGNFRCILPLGGTSGNGPGHYYFKFSSASNNAAYNGRQYELTAWTNKTPISGDSKTEAEPNGGGDCGQKNDTLAVGQKILVTIETGAGCGADEFLIILDSTNFNLTGDTLYLVMPNTTLSLGYYTDHRPYGVWSGFHNANIIDSVRYQTYTNFDAMPSGRGGMHWNNFKPNGAPTSLCGDWDGMWFYYDYDQNVQSTRDTLFEWVKWMWQDVGTRGMRVDAIKHFPPNFMGDLLDYLHDNNINPRIVVGEYFDYNAFTLKGWIDAVLASMDADTKSAISPRVFDFPLRNSLKQACDAFGYDVRNVFNESTHDKAGVSGYDLITFVENHDFAHANEVVENNPELAYAYILTNNQLGIPCVFETDYYGLPTDTANNIRAEITGLMKAHQRYIYGSNWVNYLSKFGSSYPGNYISGFPSTSMVYQLSGVDATKAIVVAINFAGDTLKLDQSLDMTRLFQGDTLTDLFSISPYPYAIVNAANKIYMQVPPRSFGIWVQGNHLDSLIDINGSVLSDISHPIESTTWLTVTPNPFQNQLMINWEGNTFTSAEVEMYNLAGQKVYSRVLDAHNDRQVLSIEEIPAGLYALRVKLDDIWYSKNIIKE